MINVKIILVSTRPGRQGAAIAGWILNEAKTQSNLNVSLIDLKEENLPFMDEPNHPRFGNYTQQHTKDWSAKIAETDAFIMVLPEYNHGYPATIKNAIDFCIVSGVINQWGLLHMAVSLQEPGVCKC